MASAAVKKSVESPQELLNQQILKKVLGKLKSGKDGTTITQALFGSFKFSDIRPLTDTVKELEGGRNPAFPEWVPADARERIRKLVKDRPKIRRMRKLIVALILLGVVGGICYKMFM